MDQDENRKLLPISSSSRKTTVSTVSSPTKSVRRNLPNAPERVLDAPNLLDDFYLNILDWGSNDILSIALSNSVFLWIGKNQTATCLTNYPESVYVSSLQFQDNLLAIGDCTGKLDFWDVTVDKLVKSIKIENDVRLPSICWNSSKRLSLAVGSRSGKIHHLDIRTPRRISVTNIHTQEVCGLKWSPDGETLASGGNDNIVKVWDAKNSLTKHTFTAHTAAVKALAWCPWKTNLLASGGGSSDRRLCFWNTFDGSLSHSLDTGSQICCMLFSDYYHELVTSHGFAENQLMVWKLPQYKMVGSINAHHSRVLQLTMSPDGTTVASAAGDENLKFWKLFERKKSTRLTEKKEKDNWSIMQKLR